MTTKETTHQTSNLWNWFIADNASQPHCGLMFARDVFATAQLSNQKLVKDLCELLNSDRSWSNDDFRLFLKSFLQSELDSPNIYVIYSQSESDFLGFEQGFWNTANGWGDIAEATRFSEDAKSDTLPSTKGNDAKWRAFSMCRNDYLPQRLLRQANEAYANEVTAKQNADDKTGDLSSDDMVAQLRKALKDCLGFVEAWQSHLEDRGGNRKAAATVEEVLVNARNVYQKVNQQLCSTKVTNVDEDRVRLDVAQAVHKNGASTGSIRSIMLQDIVGQYAAKEDVPEWTWIEDNASFSHLQNGRAPVWEFMLNIDLSFKMIPRRLAPVILQAIDDGIHYLHFHQGT